MDAAFDLIHQMDWILTRQKFKLLCQKSPRSFYVAVTADGEVAGQSYTAVLYLYIFTLDYMSVCEISFIFIHFKTVEIT